MESSYAEGSSGGAKQRSTKSCSGKCGTMAVAEATVVAATDLKSVAATTTAVTTATATAMVTVTVATVTAATTNDDSNSNIGGGDSDSGGKNNNQLKAAAEKAVTAVDSALASILLAS